MDFANKESSLAEEASVVQKLQRVEKRLEEIVAFPHTFRKRSIAIGGGFSSGKSEFVNSFITGSSVKMHVDVNRATAIPSFVISSSEVSIKGLSHNGGTVDIDPRFYSQLSHNFIDTFSFNLKEIMPYVRVEVPLVTGLFEHIYLIDTPGYNPGGGSEDRSTAADILKDRDALIWMIGLDATGTVPLDDLEFIDDLKLNGLPFYVVLNKAELRVTELKNILEEVKGTLEDEGIEPMGISAYSAVERKEYLSDGMSLDVFFLSQNQPVDNIEVELKEEIEDVFEMYEAAIVKDEKTAKWLMNQLNTLNLHISSELEHSKLDPDEMDVLTEKIDNIKKSQDKDFAPIKDQMSQIKKKMLKAVEEIFWSLSSQITEAKSQPQSTYVSRWGEKEGSDTDTKVGSRPESDGRRSTVRRQGYIKGEKYIKTDAEQSEKPAFANPQPRADSSRNVKENTKAGIQSQSTGHLPNRVPLQPHFNSPDLKKKSKRIYEVAREFNLSSSAMVSRLRNLGFTSRSPSSICTQEMVEAVQRELDIERQIVKKNTEAASQAQELINMNQATAKDFERLPGIGPKIAKLIVAYRERNGLFKGIDELLKIQGISLKMLNNLRPKLEWNLIDVLRQAKKQLSKD